MRPVLTIVLPLNLHFPSFKPNFPARVQVSTVVSLYKSKSPIGCIRWWTPPIDMRYLAAFISVTWTKFPPSHRNAVGVTDFLYETRVKGPANLSSTGPSRLSRHPNVWCFRDVKRIGVLGVWYSFCGLKNIEGEETKQSTFFAFGFVVVVEDQKSSVNFHS